jgi:hypothetical protein
MCARFTVLSDTPNGFSNRSLGYPALAQQHHLNALALGGRHPPCKGRL